MFAFHFVEIDVQKTGRGSGQNKSKKNRDDKISQEVDKSKEKLKTEK